MKDTIRMGESSVTEFKAEEAHNDSIAKEVVAFSNFMGGKFLVAMCPISQGSFGYTTLTLRGSFHDNPR